MVSVGFVYNKNTNMWICNLLHVMAMPLTENAGNSGAYYRKYIGDELLWRCFQMEQNEA